MKMFYDNTELDSAKLTFLKNSITIQAKKCLFFTKKKVNVKTTLSLFNAYTSSALNYGCETWVRKVEKYKYFLRIMFLRKSTNNLMVYFQFGRCPLFVQRKLHMLKYCCSLLKTNICIL